MHGKGAKAVAFQSDQADTSRAPALIDDVVAHFGGLDILVNNAAISVAGTVDDPDADTAALDRMHATNYLGVIAVIRAASRVLRTGGRIITVSSGLGSRVGAPGLADYSATKSGIERYTMGVARDLGPRNITANVVEAGLMEGGMQPPDPEPSMPWSARCPCNAWGTPTKSPRQSPSWRAPPRRTSRARCWTPTAATTPEPAPLPRAPKDIAPSGRAPPTTRDKAYDSKAVRGELRRRCIQALISRKGSPNIKGLGKLRQSPSRSPCSTRSNASRSAGTTYRTPRRLRLVGLQPHLLHTPQEDRTVIALRAPRRAAPDERSSPRTAAHDQGESPEYGSHQPFDLRLQDDGDSLHDLAAAHVDLLAHTTGGVFEDERLHRVLRGLAPCERQVVFAYAQREGTTWTEAAMVAGAVAPEAFGDCIRRNAKRLTEEQARRTVQRHSGRAPPSNPVLVNGPQEADVMEADSRAA